MTRRRGSASKQRSKKQTSPPSTLDASDVWQQSRWRSKVRRNLLEWFSEHARELPWRSDPQPYHVWVSEIMLQQTQVATVLPYYRRWMERFPTIGELAAADENQLMRLWEGLGYYRRVRMMHAAAKKIVNEHDGRFPADFDSVLALPGIGRYTAGAILSISGDARFPVLEGNTQRVFSRWIALREHPTEKPANALLWQLAEAMLPRTGSGTFNQAAMELGALVCTPKSPQCDRCPVQQSCQAAKLGLQAEIPGKIKQIDYQARTEFALVIRRQQGGRRQYLLRPLPEGGRWAGLWDFPRPTETELESVDQATQWLGERLGALVSPGPRLKTIRHAVTRYRIALHVHQADLHAPQADLHAPLSDQDDGSGKADSLAGTRNRDSSGAPRPDDKGFQPPRPWQWVACDEVNELPMSVTGRKIHDFLKSNRQNVLPLG